MMIQVRWTDPGGNTRLADMDMITVPNFIRDLRKVSIDQIWVENLVNKHMFAFNGESWNEVREPKSDPYKKVADELWEKNKGTLYEKKPTYTAKNVKFTMNGKEVKMADAGEWSPDVECKPITLTIKMQSGKK